MDAFDSEFGGLSGALQAKALAMPQCETVPNRVQYQLDVARQRVKDLEEAQRLLEKNPDFARLLTLMRNL